ncbi:uncharacterized protein LOC106452126 [Brassica napus]|uniref:Uncharacterized protein n=2 Tax=Brassica oleracea var. oleracea TaxID=109376 RepID=A0A0D3CAF5_BRAOL|nr:uncharacterized protein LOC106452126 [Brassica napus]
MMKPSAKSIQRVGRFLRKSLGSIKSTVCFGKHHNFSNNSTPLLSPFSCSLSHPCPQDSQTEETYSVISCESKVVADTRDERLINKSQHKKKPKKKVAAEPFEEAKRRGDMLAQKMKNLNMVDLRDVEHASDVKEALRCYSSIRSPVYLDIVDNFFGYQRFKKESWLFQSLRPLLISFAFVYYTCMVKSPITLSYYHIV